MSARPRVVTLIGWLFIAVGGGWGIGHALWHVVRGGGGSAGDLGLMVASGAIAVLGGALLLRGSVWGRWLLVFWMASHIVIGGLHDLFRLAVHAALFAPIIYFLWRPGVEAYLRRDAPARS